MAASSDIDVQLIRIDGLQVRAAMHGPTVDTYRDLMEAGTALPPVVIYVDTEGAHWLADGFHRLEAARRLDRAHIRADVRQGSRDDALWHAMGANREHGLRLTPDDVRHAVRLALKTWPSKSQRQIAEQVGCSLGLVNKVAQDVFTHEHASTPSTRVDSIGRTQPTRKPRGTPTPASAPTTTPVAVGEVQAEREAAPAADPAPAAPIAGLDLFMKLSRHWHASHSMKWRKTGRKLWKRLTPEQRAKFIDLHMTCNARAEGDVMTPLELAAAAGERAGRHAEYAAGGAA